MQLCPGMAPHSQCNIAVADRITTKTSRWYVSKLVTQTHLHPLCDFTFFTQSIFSNQLFNYNTNAMQLSLILSCQLFELGKETIYMKMQCLHAWKKTIIYHFEKCLRALLFPGFLLHLACSILLLVILFFPLCSSRGKKYKNKRCKCSCA